MMNKKNIVLCICSTLTVASVYALTFDQALDRLELSDMVIMDAATYNNEDDSYTALLAHTDTGTTAILLATINDDGSRLHSTTVLQSFAYKVQWIVSPDDIHYLVTDEYDRIVLYRADLINYKLMPVAWTHNLAAGVPSTFLRYIEKDDEFYIIQGFNQTDIAAYNIIFDVPLITAGVMTRLSGLFTHISDCAVFRNKLLLGGTNNANQTLLAHYTINSNGHLSRLAKRVIQDATTVQFCEHDSRDRNVLVETDRGLYSIDQKSLAIRAVS